MKNIANIVHLALSLFLSLGVSSCVDVKPQSNRLLLPAVPYYKKTLKGWEGLSLNKMVKEWGFPQETYSTKDIKYVVYRFPGWWQEKPSYLPEWQVACVYTWEVSRKTDIILRGKAVGFGCPIYESDAENRNTKIWNPQNRNWQTDH